MVHPIHLRRWLVLGLAGLLVPAFPALAQDGHEGQKPLPLQPGIPGMGSNHRLILKDGTYQMARTYQIVGDRVRFLSQERGDWEELPVDLVDWEATRKWERDHSGESTDASPAMKEAEELDNEEAEERADQKARMPEVAKGLELPDQDGAFVLDTFQGTPELVELTPTPLETHSKYHHGLAMLDPMAGGRSDVEIEGAHAKVHLHVNDPVIYLSLATPDQTEPVTAYALTVQTTGAKDVVNGPHGAHSASSGFAIVHVDERRAVRMVGPIHLSPAGAVLQSADVIPAKVEVLPGKHWLKLMPQTNLLIGEYALIEILSPSAINQQVWDFRVDPTLGDNPGSLGPILPQ